MKGLQGNIYLAYGQVMSSYGYRNHYVVNCDQKDIRAVALGNGSKRFGASGSDTYLPGTYVVMAYIDEGDGSPRNIGLPHLILGSFAPFTKMAGEGLETDFSLQEGILGYLGDLVGPVLNPMVDSLIEATGLRTTNKDFSFGRQLDAVVGEWSKNTPLGGAFILSDFMARISANPGCALTMDDELSMSELMAERQRYDALHYLFEVYHKNNEAYCVKQFSYDVPEGLGDWRETGAFDTETDSADIERCVAKHESQSGFFTRTLFEGGAVEGVYDVLRTVLDPREVHNSFEALTTSFPGMLTEAKRLDGTYRLQAAKEIKLVKKPVIRIPIQYNEAITQEMTDEQIEKYNADAQDKNGKTDIALKKEEFKFDEEDDVHLFNSFLHDEFANYDEAELYLHGLRKDAGVWVFTDRNAVHDNIFDGDIEPFKLPVLEPQQQSYTTDDIVSADIDAYPERPVKIFDNESVIQMADDGSIVIADGYGAELRMQRGKVTISSIGDIELLPGRDLISWAPRNCVIRARDRVEISSTRRSIAIKAEENLHLLSGNSGAGVCTIENKGQPLRPLTEVNERNLKEGLPAGEGIVIKSTRPGAGVGIFGEFIHGAGYDPQNVSSSGTTRPVCNIMLDAGKDGSMFMSGNTGSFMFDTACGFGHLTSATGFYSNGENLSMIAKGSLTTAVPNISFDKGEGKVTKPILTEKGVQQKAYALPTAEPTVTIQGSLGLRRSLQLKESILCEGGMTANQGFGVPDVHITANIQDYAGNVMAQAAEESSKPAFTLIQDAIRKTGIATEYGKKITGLAYPDSTSTAYGAANFLMLGPKWHNVLESDAKWEENGIEHDIVDEDTMPYPGAAMFEGDKKGVVTITVEDGKATKTEKSLNDWPVNGGE